MSLPDARQEMTLMLMPMPIPMPMPMLMLMPILRMMMTVKRMMGDGETMLELRTHV